VQASHSRAEPTDAQFGCRSPGVGAAGQGSQGCRGPLTGTRERSCASSANKCLLPIRADVSSARKRTAKKRAICLALEQAKIICPCFDDRVFQQFIDDALPFKANGQLVSAIRSSFGTVDESAQKVLLKPFEDDFDLATAEANPSSWFQPDSELRDRRL
jgi:hypothetical protein